MKTLKNSRSSLFLGAVLGLLFFHNVSFSQSSEVTPPPNILFIVSDDMNDELGFLGNISAKSPHLDQLASQSVVFESAYCQSPICGPSRNSFLTGRYPHKTGLYGLDPLFRDTKKWENLVALPQFFKEHGYSSNAVGKIYHTKADPKSFDQFFGWFGGFGATPKQLINLDPKLPVTPMYDWGPRSEDSETSDYKVADQAIELIREKSQEQKPFFIAAGFFRPHCPTYAPQRWFDLHPLETIPKERDRSDEVKEVPPYALKLVNYNDNQKFTQWLLHTGKSESYIQAYWACVSEMDYNVGRVLDSLKASGKFDNTIIVFCGDQGMQNGSKNLWFKRTLWEKTARVPLIIKPAANTSSLRIKAPVGLIDIYPTLCELTGLPAQEGLDGKSLAGLIQKKEDEKSRSPALTCFGPGNFSLRNDRYRYTRYADGSEELYDHETDPNEIHNLAKKPELKPVIDQFSPFVPVTSEPFIEGTKDMGSSAFPGM